MPLRIKICTPYIDARMYQLIWEAPVLYKLDANRWERQVKIDERRNDNTALMLHHKLYQFIQMAFGVWCAPGTFQRTMNVTVTDILAVCLNIPRPPIFPKSTEYHRDHVPKGVKLSEKGTQYRCT